MGDDTSSGYAPAAHYDRVHSAWRLIMGEEFHYGYFESPQTPLDRATAALTSQMLDRAEITRGARVLDVGCGTGRQSCDLAAAYDAQVLGITTSSQGVEAATALAAARGVGGARFEQRDGTANGAAASSVRAACAHSIITHSGDTAKSYAPGGCDGSYVVYEPNVCANHAAASVSMPYWK